MATKNLARTVIEGGRTRWSKYQRRNTNRSARRSGRQYNHSLRYDPELGDGTVAPTRKRVWRDHYDRLAPAERWLASFVGRPWSEARSEIARRFDTRTIAGQHIVFDHLLPSVRGIGNDMSFGRHDFEIDADGILRPLPRKRRESPLKLPPGKVRRSPREIEAWTRSRRVGRRGPGYFWFEPTEFVWLACAERYCWREHEGDGGLRRHRVPAGRFRQTQALSTGDVRYFEELSADVQKLLLLRVDAGAVRSPGPR